MPTLKLDAARLDRAGQAIYEALKGEQAFDVPWLELKRRAAYSSPDYVALNQCLDLARRALEAYADRRDGRWLR